MLRFTKAIVATAAQRTFATSTIHLGSRGGDAMIDESERIRLQDELEILQMRYKTLREQFGKLEVLKPQPLTSVELSLYIVRKALRKIDQRFRDRFKSRSSLLDIWLTPEERRDEASKRALEHFLKESEPWLPSALEMDFFTMWRRIHDERSFCPHQPELEGLPLNADEVTEAVYGCYGEMDDVCTALIEVIKSPTGEIPDGIFPDGGAE